MPASSKEFLDIQATIECIHDMTRTYSEMVSIICKSLLLLGQYTGSSSVFLQIKILVEIERCAAMQMDHSTNSREILFHGLPSKSKHPSI